MKRVYYIFLFLLHFFLFQLLNAQDGPGGIGNSSSIEVWLSSSKINLSNNDPVSSWTDISGNNNHAIQLNSINQPIFQTSQINGLPVIEFDGTNDRLELSSNITATASTIFTVCNPSSTSYKSILATNNHHISHGGTTYRAEFPSGSEQFSGTNLFSITSISTSAATMSPAPVIFTNEDNVTTSSRTGFHSLSNNSIGSLFYNGSYRFPFEGQIAEIIVFKEELNSAKRKILGNYLSAKYDLEGESDLFAYRISYGNEVIGIGQESDGSHTISRGQDSLEISSPSDLDNGEYLFIGNDGAGYSTSSDVGADASGRWTQVWRASVTGTPGTINLTFYLGANDFAVDPEDYVVYTESLDGNFSNGGTSIQESGRSYDSENNTISFSGISLNSGDYFTLAEKTGVSATNYGEPGPGGVGGASNIEVWLDASSLNLNNNDQVENWFDMSGNSRNATQLSASRRPVFSTNSLNGLPVINFDGSNDRFSFTSNIPATASTIFTVIRPTSSNYRSILATSNHHISYGSSRIRAEFPSGSTRSNKGTNFSISSISTSSEANSSVPVILTDGDNFDTKSRTGFYNLSTNSLGAIYLNGGYNYFFQGDMAEIIVFNEQLNSAKRRIVSAHLGAKYDLTPEVNLYSFASSHGKDVMGVGQESDGSHENARGKDSLEIINPSLLNNGDYILIGNDGADFSTNTSVPASAVERWNRTWRADVTGTPGTVDLRFYLGSNGFTSPSNYIILGETEDGDFTNGGTTIIADNPTFSISGYVEFSNVDLPDSAYFTLAEFNPSGTVQDGDWGSPSTWACNCVPGASDNAVINHVVTLNNDQSILALNIEADGSLEFNSNQTLSIYDDFTLNGSINTASGTIEALKATDEQLFYNNTVTPFEFYNLTVNTNTKLELESGAWALKNNLQVIAGGLDVVDADSIVLYSGSGGSSQILESMSAAFTGDFIVQRYISGRSTSYSNQASPVSGATVADWDDDLYLSGVNGNDPDINNGGTTFQSVFSFDSPTDSYNTITSTTTSLLPGIGYEVYLSNVNYFPADTIDYIGTPTTGSITVSVDQGWNLVGNPYHSFIDYDALSSTGLSSTYYVWNTDNGNYSALTGATNIAPGQGFWVEKNTAGTVNLTFDEDDKVNSNATTFFRNKVEPFTMNISNSANSFKHDLKIQFDAQAMSEYDNLDAKHLPSPIEEAPAIVSKASDSNQDLVINAINQWEESHLIPVNIHAGVEGEYTVKAENLNSALDNYSCVYLYDKTEEEQIDLSVDPSYTFHSEKGDHDRFELLFSNSLTSCEELLDDHNAVNQKLDHKLSLRNAYGKWYVDYTFEDLESRQLEISIYNMNGQLVSSPEYVGVSGSGNITISGIDNLNGVYLIQVKTQDEIVNKTVKL